MSLDREYIEIEQKKNDERRADLGTLNHIPIIVPDVSRLTNQIPLATVDPPHKVTNLLFRECATMTCEVLDLQSDWTKVKGQILFS